MTTDEPNAYNDGSWYIIRRAANTTHPGYHRKRAGGRNGSIITHCGLVGGPIPVADLHLHPEDAPIGACPECLAVT